MIDNWCTVIGADMHACNMRNLVLTGKLTHMAKAACNIVGGHYEGPAANGSINDIEAAACHPHHSPLIYQCGDQHLPLTRTQSSGIILHGLEYGFHIGFDRAACSLCAARSNMGSCRSNPQQVYNYIWEERAAGRIIGPIPRALARFCHTSPIGIIPKPHQQGGWQLIVNLSSPEGHSVNDTISLLTSLCIS